MPAKATKRSHKGTQTAVREGREGLHIWTSHACVQARAHTSHMEPPSLSSLSTEEGADSTLCRSRSNSRDTARRLLKGGSLSNAGSQLSSAGPRGGAALRVVLLAAHGTGEPVGARATPPYLRADVFRLPGESVQAFLHRLPAVVEGAGVVHIPLLYAQPGGPASQSPPWWSTVRLNGRVIRPTR